MSTAALALLESGVSGRSTPEGTETGKEAEGAFGDLLALFMAQGAVAAPVQAAPAGQEEAGVSVVASPVARAGQQPVSALPVDALPVAMAPSGSPPSPAIGPSGGGTEMPAGITPTLAEPVTGQTPAGIAVASPQGDRIGALLPDTSVDGAVRVAAGAAPGTTAPAAMEIDVEAVSPVHAGRAGAPGALTRSVGHAPTLKEGAVESGVMTPEVPPVVVSRPTSDPPAGGADRGGEPAVAPAPARAGLVHPERHKPFDGDAGSALSFVTGVRRGAAANVLDAANSPASPGDTAAGLSFLDRAPDGSVPLTGVAAASPALVHDESAGPGAQAGGSPASPPAPGALPPAPGTVPAEETVAAFPQVRPDAGRVVTPRVEAPGDSVPDVADVADRGGGVTPGAAQPGQAITGGVSGPSGTDKSPASTGQSPGGRSEAGPAGGPGGADDAPLDAGAADRLGLSAPAQDSSPGPARRPEAALRPAADLRVRVDELLRLVADQARVHAGPEGTTIHLSLEPEHLGPVKVEITWHGDAVAARFGVETPEARAMIEHGLRRLDDALREQGIAVASLQVALGGARDWGGGHRRAAPEDRSDSAGSSTRGLTAVEAARPRAPAGRVDFLA